MSGDLLHGLQEAANASRARASVVRHPEARRHMLVAARYYDHAAVAVIRAAQAESDAKAFDPPTTGG